MYRVWNPSPAAARSEVHRWDIPWGERLTGHRLFLPGWRPENECERGGLDKQLTFGLNLCLFIRSNSRNCISSAGEKTECISSNQKVSHYSAGEAAAGNMKQKASLSYSLGICGFPLCKNCSLLNIPHMFFFHRKKAMLICLSPQTTKICRWRSSNVVHYSTPQFSSLFLSRPHHHFLSFPSFVVSWQRIANSCL